ncbi:transglycosylase SLT domain-containing protein [Candidatus Micrarchaeota archaeon]|nr:transglycosylase SLT domain-containing protein [Candidatus Micrarchaeota archaeon]
MKFSFLLAFLIIANTAIAANFQNYDPDTIIVTDVIPQVNIPPAFKSNLATDYLADLRCTNYVSRQECENIKDYIRAFANTNFPRSCEGKITRDYLSAVYYWQIYAESSFNRNGYESNGKSYGLAQFIQETANAYKLYDRFDDRENIRAQSEYMKDILNMQHVKCNLPLGIAAYNTGPYNKVIKQGTIPNVIRLPSGDEARPGSYVRRIFTNVESTTKLPVEYPQFV